MKVALYARVSTEEQAKHGLSIDTQLDNLRNWAKENGHSIIDEYVDAGVSARKAPAKRPELQRLLGDLDKIELIAFTKLDRWTRNVKGYHDVLEQLEAHRVMWTAIHEDYSTTDAASRFKVNILLAVSEAEADRTSERIKVVLERKIAKGEHIGPHPPLGYSVLDNRLVPDGDADIARSVFRVYQSTGKIYAALDYLHQQGISLLYTTVRKMLKNELYAGRFHGNPNYCEPIIPPPEFDRVQAMLTERSVRNNPTKREYIFSGLVKCACCGFNMYGIYHDRNADPSKYRYRCDRHHMHHLCDNKATIREITLEDSLLTMLEAEIGTFIAGTKPKAKKAPDNTKKLERLNELYIEGVITREQFDEKRSKLIAPPDPPAPDRSALKEIALSDNIREGYNLLSRSEKRMLWRSIIDSIEFDGENTTVVFRQ